MTPALPSSTEPLLLYDGVCALCNWSVRLVLRFDRTKTMRFAPLQGPTAGAVLARHPELEEADSLVLVETRPGGLEQVSIRSTALLRILRYLGGPWRILLAGYVVPREIRDSLYDVVAHWRYRVFGRYASCPLPPAGARERFLP